MFSVSWVQVPFFLTDSHDPVLCFAIIPFCYYCLHKLIQLTYLLFMMLTSIQLQYDFLGSPRGETTMESCGKVFSTAKNGSEGFNWLKTHPNIMGIPHNQQLGHSWLIITSQAYHDNWSVLDDQVVVRVSETQLQVGNKIILVRSALRANRKFTLIPLHVAIFIKRFPLVVAWFCPRRQIIWDWHGVAGAMTDAMHSPFSRWRGNKIVIVFLRNITFTMECL